MSHIDDPLSTRFGGGNLKRLFLAPKSTFFMKIFFSPPKCTDCYFKCTICLYYLELNVVQSTDYRETLQIKVAICSMKRDLKSANVNFEIVKYVVDT